MPLASTRPIQSPSRTGPDKRASRRPPPVSTPTQGIKTTRENSPQVNQGSVLNNALQGGQQDQQQQALGLAQLAQFGQQQTAPMIQTPDFFSSLQFSRPGAQNYNGGFNPGGGFNPSNYGGLGSFMGSLRQQESGGNYQAMGPPTKYGRATGAYQFLDSTWQSVAGEYASQYPSAYLAPPEIQDQVASQYMTDLFNQFGSWELVAWAWHAGPGVAAQVASGNAPTTSDGYISTADYVAQILGRL